MENLFVKLFGFYFIIVNVISFITMYADKKRAEAHKWRVPEVRLFILAAALGSIGILAGMKVFRHKTKHMKFVIGIPFILIVQIIIGYFLIRQ